MNFVKNFGGVFMSKDPIHDKCLFQGSTNKWVKMGLTYVF